MLWGVLLSGCITAVPMQTASAVPRGVARLGGELSATPWCSFTLNPLNNCARQPSSVPLPEVRADARLGLGDGFDFGASGRFAGVIARGAQLGVLLDAKKEVFSREVAPGRRWLVSVAPGVGADFILLSTPPSNVAFQASLPAYVGYQTEGVEWVAGARVLERFTGSNLASSGLLGVPEFGLSAGLFTRGFPRWGAQLSYQAPFELAGSGLFTVSGAVLFDVGTPAP